MLKLDIHVKFKCVLQYLDVLNGIYGAEEVHLLRDLAPTHLVVRFVIWLDQKAHMGDLLNYSNLRFS